MRFSNLNLNICVYTPKTSIFGILFFCDINNNVHVDEKVFTLTFGGEKCYSLMSELLKNMGLDLPKIKHAKTGFSENFILLREGVYMNWETTYIA